MPWTTADVDGFKKGLSPEEKTRWVAVANNVLKGCMASGGKEEDCAKRAIMIANSRVKPGGGGPPGQGNG